MYTWHSTYTTRPQHNVANIFLSIVFLIGTNQVIVRAIGYIGTDGQGMRHHGVQRRGAAPTPPAADHRPPLPLRIKPLSSIMINVSPNATRSRQIEKLFTQRRN